MTTLTLQRLAEIEAAAAQLGPHDRACDPATVAALCNAYRERDALAAQLTGYDAAREMLNVQDNKIDALRSALRIARETIYSLDAREIYDDELALIDAALAEGRS